MPSDAALAFNSDAGGINASEQEDNSFKAPSYANMINVSVSGRSGRLSTTQAEGGLAPSSF